MENTPTITMPRKEAKMFYQDYLGAVKTRKEKYVKELKQVYYHLSKGNKVLDIYEVFKKTGVNKDGDPKLAIALASERNVNFEKRELGAGRFETGQFRFYVDLPTKTFPKWKTRLNKGEDRYFGNQWVRKGARFIIKQEISTKVPIVPAHLLPEGSLENYYILWEVVKGWEKMPVVKDPFLLKRINANAFVVLAEWEITAIEQAIIRGR